MLDSKRREFIALLGSGGLLLAAKVKRSIAYHRTTWRSSRWRISSRV